VVQKLKACIIGASGFIGINLCLGLSRAGFDVTATIRFGGAEKNLRAVFKRENVSVKLCYLDCLREGDLEQFISENTSFDLAINATGYAVQREQKDIELAKKINSDLPVLIAKAFDGHSERFVNLGSAYEYGKLGGCVTEDMLCDPDTLYGITKLEGTRKLLDSHLKASKLICLRMFGIFGLYETPTKLFPILYGIHTKKENVTFSHGLQKVDYMHVNNVVDALTALTNRAFKTEKDIFNVGSGHPFTIREIATKFSAIMAIKNEICWGKATIRLSNEGTQYANTKKIRNVCGWIPALDLDSGINLFINETRDRKI